MQGFRYSRWQGLEAADLSAGELLDHLADDFLAQGDLTQALRQLLQKGATGHDGARLPGLHDLLRQLRGRRQDILRRHNLDALSDRLRTGLEEAVDLERQGIQRRLDSMRPRSPRDPWDGDAEQFQDMFRQLATKHLAALDALPHDLGGKVQALQEYEFLDQEARQRFQEVLEELQRAVLNSLFRDLSQRLQSLTPEDLQDIERLARAIQEMVDTRRGGGAPDFQRFLDQFGHYFGDQPPQSLDQLLDQMQAQMARMQSLLTSLSPAQQADLRELVNRRLLSPGLDEALERLARTLWDRAASRQRGQSYRFSGEDPVSLAEALRLMGDLHQLDALERQLERVRFGAPLEEVDRETLRQVLGDEADQILDALGQIARRLEAAGLVERSGGRLTLTPRGIRRIGQKALADIFQRLTRSAFGDHTVRVSGPGPDLADDTRPYEFGQPFFLHLERTLRHALARQVSLPVRLAPEDFEVYRTEWSTRTATVLMLDLSRSMPMRGNFVAAKKVALALNHLIRTQFPRDQLYVVGFSGVAREIKSEDLPSVEVGEFGRGTNVQAGLAVARRLLARHKGATRQVILVTDGEPTAYVEADGQVAIEFPPSYRVLRATLREVQRCTREDIVLNIFMLERSAPLRSFVQQMAQSNRGRVFFTSADQLGEYLLVDYVARKQRRIG